jgi:hypothetical protein
MEVAEELLLAFQKAADALEAVRQPFETQGTLAESARERGLDPAKPSRNEYYVVKFNRLIEAKVKSEDLRKAQILGRYFLGPSAAKSAEDFERIWREIFSAQFVLARQPEPEIEELETLRAKAVRGMAQPDEVDECIDRVRADLEQACVYHIRMRAAFVPIRVNASGLMSWLRQTVWA